VYDGKGRGIAGLASGSCIIMQARCRRALKMSLSGNTCLKPEIDIGFVVRRGNGVPDY